jgi:hypothetical protein
MSEKMREKILATISTKDRYDVLHLAIQSIALQTVKPTKLIIYDDGEHKDLRKVDVYNHLFHLLEDKGIEWEVVFGEGKGQHFNHQKANKMGYEFDFIWRLDDDEFATPEVLEKLLRHMSPAVAAVGGSVITPKAESPGGTNKIEDVFHTPNMQWCRGEGVVDVDHLYSSFLYVPGIVDYNLDLSPVAHREETMFTYSMKRAGYKLLVDRSAVTYHYRQTTGGIRSHDNKWFYQHDDKIFMRKLEEWGYKFCSLNSGLGDHLAFSSKALPRLIEKHEHVVLGCCYPEVFKDFPVKTIPVGAVMGALPDENVYKFMINEHWKKSIVDAYVKMYGVEDDNN